MLPGEQRPVAQRFHEADALEKLLRREGIPCRVRRTGGVFHGESADALRLLLDLMASAASPETTPPSRGCGGSGGCSRGG